MPGLFTELNGHVTQEQLDRMNKSGIIPSDAKSPEEKRYIVIFVTKDTLESQIAEGIEINESIIVDGRYNLFNAIKNYLIADMETEKIIDIKKSIVMVEGVDAGKAVSLYRFIGLCNKSYPNEEFDELNSYIEEEVINPVPNNTNTATGNALFGGTFLKED